jgi:shikimate kinase
VVIYLIGPSRVGKTSCAKYAAEILEAEHRDLDELCERRHTADWGYCQERFDDAERESQASGTLIIVDLGAGTQHDCTLALQSYLESRRERVFLIYASMEEVLLRYSNRTREDLEEKEYSPARERLYRSAPHRLDVSGKSEGDTVAEFASYLRTVLGVAIRNRQT